MSVKIVVYVHNGKHLKSIFDTFSVTVCDETINATDGISKM